MTGIISDNIGRSSGLVKAASGGGGITWQSVTTGSTLTAESGKGYPINTTSNACTVTLPASPSVGDEIALLDYAGTADTNKITINPGSLKLQYATTDLFMDVERECVVLTYVDSTQGWLVTRGANEGETALGLPIFCDFLVLAGGGSGQEDNSGGGGAGGLRSSMTATGGGGSNESQIILTSGQAYTATVGAGYNASNADSGSGANSVLSGTGITTITSIGGGEAGGHTGYGGQANGAAGGCGGGGSSQHGGGTGGAFSDDVEPNVVDLHVYTADLSNYNLQWYRLAEGTVGASEDQTNIKFNFIVSGLNPALEDALVLEDTTNTLVGGTGVAGGGIGPDPS